MSVEQRPRPIRVKETVRLLERNMVKDDEHSSNNISSSSAFKFANKVEMIGKQCSLENVVSRLYLPSKRKGSTFYPT